MASAKKKPLKIMGPEGHAPLKKKLAANEHVEVYSNPHNCMVTVVGMREEPNGDTVYHVRLPNGEFVNGMTVENLAFEEPEMIANPELPVPEAITLDPLNRAGIELDDIIELHKELAQKKVILPPSYGQVG